MRRFLAQAIIFAIGTPYVLALGVAGLLDLDVVKTHLEKLAKAVDWEAGHD